MGVNSTRKKKGGEENMLKILLVIPTFNNEKTIRDVAKRAISTQLPVLVVIDGSTDSTVEMIQGIGVDSIAFPQNRGKGAAIIAGADWASAKGYTHIITIDADGQHDPSEVTKFYEPMEKDPLCITVGNRQFKENVPFSSRFGRKFSNMWLWITSGHTLSDSQSGFRAYPVEVLRKVKCVSRRYDFEVEILVRGTWAGVALKNVDVSVHYSEETRNGSHFDPFRDNMRISKLYARLFIRNYTPFPHKKIFNTDKKKITPLHPVKAIKIFLSERLLPKEIAYASMLGVFMGALPLIACHSIAIFFVSSKLRLNRVVALAASNLCMPPFVPAMEIELGHYIRHGKYLTEFTVQTLAYEADQRLLEYLIGSLLIGPVLAVFIGGVAYMLSSAFYSINYGRRSNEK